MGKNEGFKFRRISLKSEEKGEGSSFYFLDFPIHVVAWFGHAAAWLKNTGFVQGLHAPTQGKHAAACCSRVFVWRLSMPRHDETVSRHDSVFFL